MKQTLNTILNYQSKYENPSYEKLNQIRYYLAIYLSQPNYIGGELFFIYKNNKALLNFKYTTFENIKNVKTLFLIKPLRIRGDISHAAFLLFDINNKNWQYFDPAGTTAIWYNDILKGIFSFMKFYAPDFKYNPLRCIGLQTGNDSRCADWTLLFIYLKCLYPTLTIEEITNFLIGVPGTRDERLDLLIEKWQNYEWDIREEYKFQEFLIADVLMSERLSPEEYNKTIKEEYQYLSKKNVNKAKSVYENALGLQDIKKREYFNELVSDLN